MANELTSALIGLAGVMIGGGMTTGMSYMLARSDRNKFARERIWEVRREVYTKMIAISGKIERALEDHVHNFSDEAGGENYPHSKAYISAERTIFLMEVELDQLITLNRVIVSKTVFHWHRALIGELGDFVEYPDRYEPHDIASGQLKIYETQTQRLISLAQGELGVGN